MKASFRSLVHVILAGIASATLAPAIAQNNSQSPQTTGANIAVAATPSTSFVSGDTTVSALNDGFDPRSSRDTRHGSYGNWNRTSTQWVQYDWSQPISTRQVDVYWWIDGAGVGAPKACRLLYWDGKAFVPVKNAQGLGVEGNQFNTTTFDEVTTSKLRLEIDSDGTLSTGILEWKVRDSGKSPKFPPTVAAGVDRNVVLGGKTYLSGKMKSIYGGTNATAKTVWSKASGPGKVQFENPEELMTTATFSKTGDYVLTLTAAEGKFKSSSTLQVKVVQPPPADRLDVVYTKPYKIDSPLWNARAKAIIVNWIPHCIDQINTPDLRQGTGGIDNFIDAAKALKGEPLEEGHGHRGYVFANAWVHQTVEAMCIALMVDAQGDPEILKAQEKFRATLNDWIPIILAAQEPDGYLQTAFEERRVNRGRDGSIRYDNGPFRRWTRRGDHEGYTAGYFIESAINHYTLTNGKDKRLYDAAKRLADCWYDHIGPAPKQAWYDGHEEMEQALVRFGRFVNDMEGNGKGDHYIELAKFLLDCRSTASNDRERSEYDQSHVPVIQQYEAVGHAVRAAYLYSGMADVAAETHNPDYQSAVMSLWDNLVNKKYYVTGGIGSGETSEGFGPNYSLRNPNAYCEACSSCGEIFFQWKMNLAYHDAKYADLYEETMYNALLGSLDLEARNFYYDNPLTSGRERYPWHTCPCCVGNMPRTLLMVPTWTYAKSKDGIYVNLFIGSTIDVEKVAGTDVQMVQKTDYPWSGNVAITVNPKTATRFVVAVRVPNRTTSELYKPTPQVSGLKSLSVNGSAMKPKIENGYAMIDREWKAGDRIEVVFPMEAQRIKADPKITADNGFVALRYGPMIYNVEHADQPDLNQALGTGPLSTEWRPDLLDGVVTIKGTWANGSPMLAIPNYARNNRGSQATGAVGGDSSVDYSGASASGSAAAGGSSTNRPASNGVAAGGGGARRGRGFSAATSTVWMKD